MLLFLFNIQIDKHFVAEAGEATEFSDIGLTVFPEKATYNDNVVITISVPDQIQPTAVTIDTSEVGGPSEMKVDPTLMEHTIAIKDSTTAGVKTLPIHIQDDTGESVTS